MPVEIGNWHSRKDSHPHSWGASRCPVRLGCVNLATGELETPNSEHDGRIWFLSFPGNGQRLATASADGTARLWDVRMRSPEPRIWTNGTSTWDAKFSPDSRCFVMTGLGAAEVRETATGALRRRLPLEGLVT